MYLQSLVAKMMNLARGFARMFSMVGGTRHIGNQIGITKFPCFGVDFQDHVHQNCVNQQLKQYQRQ